MFSFSQLIEEWEAQNEGMTNLLNDPISKLQVIELQLRENPDSWDTLWQEGELEPLMKFAFSSLFFKGQLGFIKVPFENFTFRYQTEAFQKELNEERWELKVDPHDFISPTSRDILLAGTAVLNTFYKQKAKIYTAELMTLRDRHTKMERHFKFHIQLDYLNIKAVKPLKKLSKKQIHELLNNLHDEELWLKYIPPANFLFEGFLIGVLSDVTKEEILSEMKVMVANEGVKSDHENDRDHLEVLARSFLDMPELQFGTLQVGSNPWTESLAWCLLRQHDHTIIQPSLKGPEGAYAQVLQNNQATVVEDLSLRKHLSPVEEALLAKGLRSLLLAPLRNQDGKIISMLELASPEPYRFSQFTVFELEEFISLMEMGNNVFFQEMENATQLTIQQEFTSIHPSVEWRFREVASTYHWDRVMEDNQSRMGEIVFKDVYPLYGQADIVGSSNKRNASIEADLMDNLERLYQVLVACKQAVPFHLLDVYAMRGKSQTRRH